MKKILEYLDIHEIITLHKKRITFIYQDLVEVSLDQVDDLGFFIEIEILDKNMDIEKANLLLKQLIEE